MKRIILSALVFAASFNLSAQHQFGFSADAGLSKMKAENLSIDTQRQVNVDSDYKPSFGLGAIYSYQFDIISLETGVNYNFISGATWQTFEDQINPLPSTQPLRSIMDRNAHYINIPLTVNVTLNKFSVGAGVSAGFLVSNSYYFSSGNSNFNGVIVGGGNDLARFDYGLNAQIGYEILDNLRLQSRFYFGLNNVGSTVEESILNSVYGLTEVDRSLKNRQISLGLKYMIGS